MHIDDNYKCEININFNGIASSEINLVITCFKISKISLLAMLLIILYETFKRGW